MNITEEKSQKEQKFVFGLKSKFILMITVLIIISIRLIGQNSFSTARKGFTRITNSLLVEISNTVAEQIQGNNAREMSIVRTLAQTPTIKDTSLSLMDKGFFLLDMKQLNPDVYENIGFLDTKGDTMIAPYFVMNFMDSPYYGVCMQGKEYISSPIANTLVEGAGPWIRFYSCPVFDDNHNVTGIMNAILKGNSLEQVVKEIDLGDDCHPYVFDMESGDIIGQVEGDKPFAEDSEDPEFLAIKDNLLKGQTGTGRYQYNGVSMVAAYRPVGDGTSWAILCAAPESCYNTEIRTIYSTLMSGSLISILIAAVVGFISIRLLIRPLVNIRHAVDEIATGDADLTKRIQKRTNDDIGKVVNSFNAFIQKLQDIIKELKASKVHMIQAGEELSASSAKASQSINEIISNIDVVSNQISTQTQSVDETAGAVNEIASNIESLERMIENQSNGIMQASTAVEEMMGNINSVNTSVDRMADSFITLSSRASAGVEKQMNAAELMQQIKAQSETLQEANAAIAAIAEQTNLLAMNAAIEAAHAGDAGKGFSVVADEIRKLSETSTEESRTIGDQLNAIQHSIDEMTAASEESNEAFQSVNEKIAETDQIVRQIKAAMEEQTEGSKQIGEVLQVMNDSTSEVRVASREMSEGNKQILEEIKRLQDSTASMNSSMGEMAAGAQVITQAGSELNSISSKVNSTIAEIGQQIDKFHV